MLNNIRDAKSGDNRIGDTLYAEFRKKFTAKEGKQVNTHHTRYIKAIYLREKKQL